MNLFPLALFKKIHIVRESNQSWLICYCYEIACVLSDVWEITTLAKYANTIIKQFVWTKEKLSLILETKTYNCDFSFVLKDYNFIYN